MGTVKALVWKKHQILRTSPLCLGVEEQEYNVRLSFQMLVDVSPVYIPPPLLRLNVDFADLADFVESVEFVGFVGFVEFEGIEDLCAFLRTQRSSICARICIRCRTCKSSYFTACTCHCLVV